MTSLGHNDLNGLAYCALLKKKVFILIALILKVTWLSKNSPECSFCTAVLLVFQYQGVGYQNAYTHLKSGLQAWVSPAPVTNTPATPTAIQCFFGDI